MKREGSMNESPLPKLTESREDAKKKIWARIEKGMELSPFPKPFLFSFEDWLKSCVEWSEYNDILLVKLFNDDIVKNRYYIPFNSRSKSMFDDEDITDIVEGVERLQESIDSLKQIRGQLELYDEPLRHANTTQHSFGNDVFIVHGRDDGAKETVARFVERGLGMNAIILHEQPSGGETIIEKIERYSSNVGYAIALVTPDDIGALKDEEDDVLNPRARQNVVFELAYFMGKLGRQRVCLLLKDQVELPSDIGGISYISMDAPGAWRETLRREINAVIEAVPGE